MFSSLNRLYGIGDVIDRWFVLLHKIDIKMHNGESFDKEAQESNMVKDYLSEVTGGDLAMHIEQLFLANHDIWTLESDLRQGKQISDEEAGRKSKLIREINDMRRVAHRNAINRITRTGYTEEKIK